MKKLTIDAPESHSLNLVKKNIEQMQQLFPNTIKEGKVDFDALKTILGDYCDTPKERFGLNWAGKTEAAREAQRTSNGTLRPCPADSKNWDNTQNVYIEGDNLEVLKLLQKSYQGKVDLIYIDPPYNTGNDFVYNDDYKDNLENYLEQIGESKLWSTQALNDSDGRFHSKWLSMMYPRLVLARNLMADNAVIFISIDDHEQSHLRKICDEIFGENNFVAQIIWERAYAPINLKKHFSESHDYIICYAKDIQKAVCNGLPRSENANNRYQNPDNDARGVWISDNLSVGPRVESNVYEIMTPGGRRVLPPSGYSWRLNKETFEEYKKDNRIWFGEKGNNVPSIKRFLSEVKQGITPMTIWKRTEVGDSQDATQKLIQLFDGNKYFDYPKPVGLIERCIKLYSNKNSIILDFFSGSATTAHAVIKTNSEDGLNRKFIMVQIPESIRKNIDNIDTIARFGEERIRRAGNKIIKEIEEEIAQKEKELIKLQEKKEKQGPALIEEEDETTKQIADIKTKINERKERIKTLDTGFRVFKLDSSNINEWDADPNHLQETIKNSIYHIKNDRTDEDLFYEILIKYGIPLSEKINVHSINGKNIYELGAGSLMVCLADNIDTNTAEGMGKLWEQVKPEGDDTECKVVFKDSGFRSDEDKTNTELVLKRYGIENVASI